VTGLLARLALAAGLALASLVAVGAGPAHACSCIQVDTATSARLADRVFTGVVDERSPGDKSLGAGVRYAVSVSSVYKGVVGEQIDVFTAASSASCGLPDLPEGTELVWFASERNPAGGGRAEEAGPGELRLYVSSCDPNGPATPRVMAAVAGALGPPGPPVEVSDQPSPDQPTGSTPTPDPTDGTPTSGPTDEPSAGPGAGEAAVDEPDDGTPAWPWAVGAGAVLAAAGALLVARRRTVRSTGR
jgi:hypothetical protein